MSYQISIHDRLECWYCNGQMYYHTFTTCFGETCHFYECAKCHFVLDRDFVEKYGPERPTAA